MSDYDLRLKILWLFTQEQLSVNNTEVLEKAKKYYDWVTEKENGYLDYEKFGEIKE